ncbi:MAG: DUF1232 domain-containing protein [Sphingobacteriales bacterium JAD_PAG50586_3]|nr:MAG: DUF1232 domain-containing protein [Sphingobacteriales bacterium JAD_PAG50586_3]
MIKHAVKNKGYLNQDTLAMVLAYARTDTPFTAKLIGVATLIYIFMPVDIIPDVIPLAGWLDDLIIGYQLTNWAKSFVPEPIMEECRVDAAVKAKQIRRWLIGLAIVFVVFAISMMFVLWKLVEWLFGLI